MNEMASKYWGLACKWLDDANDAEDVNTTICYTGLAEQALNMARFAVENPYLVAGLNEYAPPPGAVVNEEGVPVPGPDYPAPPQPMSGPKFWGAPAP